MFENTSMVNIDNISRKRHLILQKYLPEVRCFPCNEFLQQEEQKTFQQSMSFIYNKNQMH